MGKELNRREKVKRALTIAVLVVAILVIVTLFVATVYGRFTLGLEILFCIRDFILGIVAGIAENLSGIWEFILGIVVGIGTNLFAWWMLFHAIVPKIHFSPSISKTTVSNEPYNRSGYRYRVKFENAGRRPIIDIEITAKVVIEGIGPYRKSTNQWIRLPLKPDGKLEYRLSRLRPVKPGKKFRHIIRFYINSGSVFLNPSFFPAHVHRKAEQKRLLLEDLLALDGQTYLEVQAFGYDEFSGTRKYFRSKLYRLDDIHEGPFDKDGLGVKVKSSSDKNHHEALIQTKTLSDVTLSDGTKSKAGRYQCLGTTAQGRQCQRKVVYEGGYCWQHSDQAERQLADDVTTPIITIVL